MTTGPCYPLPPEQKNCAFPILSHFFWLYRKHDNEGWDKGGGLDQANKLLVKKWKALLSGHTNAELGIDSQFSRPAIEIILEDFAKSVKHCDSLKENRVSFEWKP
jgi:hypothetical protein